MTFYRRYSRTTYLILCGLFTALTAICSFITIPLGFTPVPLNLGTLAVFLTGGILGKKYGTVSMTVYVLLGAAGIPVFSGFRGGVGVLAGPTGGYLAGYIAAVFVIGLIMDAAETGKRREISSPRGDAKRREINSPRSDAKRREMGSHRSDAMRREISSPRGDAKRRTSRETALCICALITGTAVCYTLGSLWFMLSTGAELWVTLTACVFPFLPGDALKTAAAVMLIGRLRPYL